MLTGQAGPIPPQFVGMNGWVSFQPSRETFVGSAKETELSSPCLRLVELATIATMAAKTSVVLSGRSPLVATHKHQTMAGSLLQSAFRQNGLFLPKRHSAMWRLRTSSRRRSRCTLFDEAV